jgi:hypothetical protein
VLPTVDNSYLGDIDSLFADYVPTPRVQNSQNSPPNEASTAPVARRTMFPSEEVARPQPSVENASSAVQEAGSFEMDPLQASGRSNLSSWVYEQTRLLNTHLAGADSDGEGHQYQKRVTKVIIQMYKLRMACMKLKGVQSMPGVD